MERSRHPSEGKKSDHERSSRRRDHGKSHPQKRQREEGQGMGRRGERAPHRPTGSHAKSLRQSAVFATVDKNRKGFAFLLFDDRKREDGFVPPRYAASLFHGDRVEVQLDSSGKINSLRVTAHRFRELVGRYQPHPRSPERGGWVIYERKNAREEVYIPGAQPKIVPGDWVRVELEFKESGEHAVQGKILAHYGKDLPPAADLPMVAGEFNLTEEHTPEAIAEAKAFKIEVPGRDLEARTDHRKIPLITIDGETARDFDDAVFVERHGSHYVLWVAIADVSHYVKEGTHLDREARARGTSVYFPERAFHMLPRELSENLCSLKPHEPRLAMTAKMQIDQHGKILKTELFESVIESKRRATYNEIQNEWNLHHKNPKWEFHPHFELYRILRKQRSERGSLDFDLPEAELKVKPTGEVDSIRIRARLDAHRLIEEFMIAANEAVTTWALERKWPFVYRTHDTPSTEALDRFQKLAAMLGVKVDLGGGSPKVMAESVRRFAGHPAETMLNMQMLRSMKQAVYAAIHGGHFGLASEGYTHFTSPIRRYPDLVVHRLLRHALRAEKSQEAPLSEVARAKMDQELDEICTHCSARERLASDAERESIKLKQVRAISAHVGEKFDAKITGLVESGIFCQIVDPYCEGLIPLDSMLDDRYQFNEQRMQTQGMRGRKVYKIGDPIQVQVVSADLERRLIELAVYEEGRNLAKKPQPASHTQERSRFRQDEPKGGKGRQERGGRRRQKHRR
jgi:ribonuclease R